MKYPDDYINKIICGKNLEVLPELPAESVNCVVTSPPYWGLRDYEVKGQLGLEKTFEEYITDLCDIFDEVKRVLRKDGTCWVNLGDSYASSGGAGRHFGYQDPKYKNGRCGNYVEPSAFKQSVLPKSLCLVPQRFAIEMANQGWILRNTLIWHKPNCMPSSAKDRFTVDFEYIYFFTKSKKYWFEQQFEEHLTKENRPDGVVRNRTFNYKGKYSAKGGFKGGCSDKNTLTLYNPQGRNKRAVWNIPTQPFSEAHFAVYPEKLIEPMIKAGCPKGGIVLDPFMGAGTTAIVAKKQGKRYIGIEIKQEYIDMANKRIKKIPELLF
jgi:site-specific DNA-methyltransferase (adenine-specific)